MQILVEEKYLDYCTLTHEYGVDLIDTLEDIYNRRRAAREDQNPSSKKKNNKKKKKKNKAEQCK